MTADTPVVILAIPLGIEARPCLESLLRTGHAEFLLSVPEALGPLAMRLGKRAAVTTLAWPPVAQTRESPTESRQAPPAHLLAWQDALRLVPNGRRFACLTADLLVTVPLADAWSEARPTPFGLAAPRWRPDRLESFNPKLLLGQGGPAVQYEFGLILADIPRIAMTSAGLYGGVIPAAVAKAAARADEGGGTIVARLPERWCQMSRTAAVIDGARTVAADQARELLDGWETRLP